MRTIVTTAEIAAPASKVFEFVSDQLNAPLWQAGLTSVRRTTDGPIGVGSKHVFVRSFAGRTVESTNEFVEFVPGEYLRFEIGDNSMTGVASYRVLPINDERCEMISTLRFIKLGWMAPLAPLLRRALIKETNRDEQALKTLLESST